MLRSAPHLRRGALLSRGRNEVSVRDGPGSAEQREERCTASGTKLNLLQRRDKILDQIVAVLEAGGESDKALADAEFGARLRRQPLVRGGRRMGDQALGVAEVVADARK